MTETAQKIMELFGQHPKVEAGMVLPFKELSRTAKKWGPKHVSGLEAAMEELRQEGYVIITTPHGLELTTLGVSYLLSD